jgi:TRAP-type C4-dicarboxylate transport system permease small subunit
VSLPEVSVAYTQSVIPISAVLIVLAELLTLPDALARAHAVLPTTTGGEASH